MPCVYYHLKFKKHNIFATMHLTTILSDSSKGCLKEIANSH